MNAPRRPSFESPVEVHHAPGIPCGIGLRHPDIPIWYSLEPEGITCRHRACRKAKRDMERERRVLAPARSLASLETFG